MLILVVPLLNYQIIRSCNVSDSSMDLLAQIFEVVLREKAEEGVLVAEFGGGSLSSGWSFLASSLLQPLLGHRLT